MPCSEPRFEELRKHQEAAIPLLCEAIKILRAEHGHLGMTSEALQKWAALHDFIDSLPGGWKGYKAAEFLELLKKHEETK